MATEGVALAEDPTYQ